MAEMDRLWCQRDRVCYTKQIIHSPDESCNYYYYNYGCTEHVAKSTMWVLPWLYYDTAWNVNFM